MKAMLMAGAALALMASAAAAQTDPDRVPGPLWNQGIGQSDPVDSFTYYPVLGGSLRPCRHAGRETTDPALLEACRAGDDIYRRRVHHMVAGMNLPDDAERMEHCRKMGELVAQDFDHTEGRSDFNDAGEGGWAARGKDGLLQACKSRAFRLSGFFGEVRRPVAKNPNRVTVTTCYWYDQHDPKGIVKGTGRLLENGRREVTRISVEQISRAGPEAPWLIDFHNAHDVTPETVRRACAVR